jgi:hypothetical protein
MLASEAAISGEEPEAIFELAAETEELERPADISAEEPADTISQSSLSPAQPSSQESPVGSGSSVQKAIDEVNGVVDTLRGALDDMEEVLEMLEMFERQQNVDEREIESLRRAVRQIHRPRDSGQHQRR